MARMIPPTIGDDAPPGEHAVFAALRAAPEDWVVFHSLEIAHHVSQVQGEADFVVVAPGHGVLVIEVKSHESIEADGDGRWRYGNRDWVTRSPFEQASGAQHSIIEYLQSKGAGPVGYPIFHAAWLTQLSKSKITPSIGWHDWQLLDAADLVGDKAPSAIIRTLNKASAHLSETISGYRRVAAQPDAPHTDRIVELLTPRFVAELSAKELARRREKEQAQFTDEQVKILDVVGTNPRLLVEGPAGSGKTWVAAEAARRASGNKQRTLVVVFNRLIEARLAELCGEGVEVRRIHSLMAQVVDRHAGRNEARRKLESGRVEPEWYDQTLPEQALEAALELGPQFDYLVVDEAQDVALEQYLDVLDALLVGGLERAPVFITGDFDHQVIYRRHEAGDEVPDARATVLRRIPGLVTLQLRSNVRTTPEVARFVAELIGEPTLYSEHRRSDDDQVSVERHTFTTMDEQQRLLADAVERILSEPFTVRELVILSPYARERSAGGQAIADPAADARLTSRLGASIGDATRIRWGSIHEFKGLEAPAVILTDVDLSKEYHRDLLYVGASRATDRLVVLEQVQ
ncbi:nuclease-related domain-containing DEAD/DEAH box helicase [Microcella sp.]|uniref:nuclease-related domain-containing DEAD/DEAH box helicase n=1 Tax=Microcella sp. TaxID=1913979 RepID=UPI00255D24AF|nr:NERD domain-containing protein [Microcella sp.]MBX9471079.1 NERD domain-containing protein [Microcella sp.]